MTNGRGSYSSHGFDTSTNTGDSSQPAPATVPSGSETVLKMNELQTIGITQLPSARTFLLPRKKWKSLLGPIQIDACEVTRVMTVLPFGR